MIFQSTPTFECVLPVDLKTQNTGRGNSWYRPAAERKRIAEMLHDHVREPFDGPVCVLYTRILGPGQRAWDNDNLAASCKQLQDALTELGWWYDDSAKWLSVIGYRHAEHRGEFPAVMVSVFEAGDDEI